MLLLKLAVLACGWRVRLDGTDQPERPHGNGWRGLWRPGGLAGAARRPAVPGGPPRSARLVALVIGITRVRLGVHTPADVVVGALVGMCGAAWLGRLAGKPRHTGMRPYLLVAPCVMILLFHGQRLQAEAGIRWLAQDIWPLSLCRHG